VTDGKLNTVSSVGIDFSEWTETQGIDVVQGSVFWLDVNSGPTIDRDVVIAQLTVPIGAYFTGVVNAQGQTKPGSKKKVWDKRAITFHGGPVQQTGTNAAKKCKADSDCTTLKNLCKATLDAKCVKKKGKEKDKDAQGECKCLARHDVTKKHEDHNENVGISKKNGDAFGVVEAQSVVGSKDGKGIPGYTTYRLSLQLSGDAGNVYTIFGRENTAMSFPPAYQVAAPFGSNVSLALTVRRAPTCPCMRPACMFSRAIAC